jgi:hypothetical protein
MTTPKGIGAGRELIESDATKYIRAQEAVIDTPLASAVSGAYSFPHDRWFALDWALGIWGYYGDYMQSKADEASRRLETLLLAVNSSSPYVFAAVSSVVSYVLANQLPRCASLEAAVRQIDRSSGGTSAANLGAAVARRDCAFFIF